MNEDKDLLYAIMFILIMAYELSMKQISTNVLKIFVNKITVILISKIFFK